MSESSEEASIGEFSSPGNQMMHSTPQHMGHQQYPHPPQYHTQAHVHPPPPQGYYEESSQSIDDQSVCGFTVSVFLFKWWIKSTG